MWEQLVGALNLCKLIKAPKSGREELVEDGALGWYLSWLPGSQSDSLPTPISPNTSSTRAAASPPFRLLLPCYPVQPEK